MLATPIATVSPASAATALYADLLAAAVKPDGQGYNKVDYRLLAANLKALDEIVSTFEGEYPSMMQDDEVKAHWINLYNAATLKVVAEHYPVESIRDIKLGGTGFFGSGPWKHRFLSVEGEDLSLDDIEHKKLRRQFNDPLVHYALNCASKSCPNLLARPFTAETVAGQLEENAAAYINHQRGVDLREEGIVASKIYTWYAKDFGGEKGLRTHWKRYALARKGSASGNRSHRTVRL